MANILVIDDAPAVRSLIRTLLASAGHTVREAVDGDDGLREFRRERADLVVCDLLMPNREGLETLTDLRHLAPALPVIMTTGGSSYLPPHQLLLTALALGASGVLAKPFAVEQLLAAVAQVLPAKGALTDTLLLGSETLPMKLRPRG